VSIVLEASGDRRLKLNAWNWGVLHAFVARGAILPGEDWDLKRHGAGEDLDALQVALLADFLERELLPLLRPGERLFYDGTVTDVPDDGTFFRAEDELWKNYSLHRDVLVEVIAFLRDAGGPVAFS